MEPKNPYESPSVIESRSTMTPVWGTTKSLVKKSIALLACTFVASVGSFIFQILLIFGDSTKYWPGWTCGAASGLFGVGIATCVFYRSELKGLGYAALLAAGASYQCLAIFGLVCIRHLVESTGLEQHLEMWWPTPVFWALLCISTFGITSALFAVIRGLQRKSYKRMFAGLISTLPCLFTLAAIVVSNIVDL